MADVISDDEKRLALKRALDSRTLLRAEQLRRLLRYVCDAEIAGQGHELNEYLLGINVFERPAGYSPADDACVRTRAYALRKRLLTYYEHEAPEDPVRIVIDKGGYRPRFEPAPRSDTAADSRGREPGLPSPELDALWRPLLDGRAPLLIAFDVRLFFIAPAVGMVVRDYNVNDPADACRSEALGAFRQCMGVTELREVWDYADFGSVHAAFLLGRLLSRTRVDVGLKHSSSLDWQDVWNSNVVFLGKPTLCPIIVTLLEGKNFQCDEAGVIHNRRPVAGEAPRYSSDVSHGRGEKFALITRLRGPQPGRHLLLLSSPAAELAWALAESVTNPGHAAELLSRLRTSEGEYPPEFQVVIRATFRSNVPVEIRYVTHRLLSSAE